MKTVFQTLKRCSRAWNGGAGADNVVQSLGCLRREHNGVPELRTAVQSSRQWRRITSVGADRVPVI